jgi:hypothetical protein
MMMTKSKISVSEALRMIESGQPLKGYSIDFERIKIEALDVMKLAKNGIEVPESAIYYDDENIIGDEDTEEDWKMIDYDPIEGLPPATEIKINLNNDIKSWLEKKNVSLENLVENLLNGFYNSQKIIEKKK